MSFKCGICQEQTKPGEKATMIVLEVREAVYPVRENANTFIRAEILNIEGRRVFLKGKLETSDDPGGVGIEISKEVLACKPCAEANDYLSTHVD